MGSFFKMSILTVGFFSLSICSFADEDISIVSNLDELKPLCKTITIDKKACSKQKTALLRACCTHQKDPQGVNFPVQLSKAPSQNTKGCVKCGGTCINDSSASNTTAFSADGGDGQTTIKKD